MIFPKRRRKKKHKLFKNKECASKGPIFYRAKKKGKKKISKNSDLLSIFPGLFFFYNLSCKVLKNLIYILQTVVCCGSWYFS